MSLTAGQIRAARALLDWNQQRLSEESGVSLATIRRIESPRGPERSTAPNKDAIRLSLEKGGVLFLAQDGSGGEGVRLKK